jgi:hypothetical protein
MSSPGTSDRQSGPWAHLAVVTWVVLAISLFAAVALTLAAAAAPGQPTPAATEAFAEAEDEGEELEGEEEFEIEEEEEEEIGAEGPLLFPEPCLLHTAEAQVTASTTHDVVRLSIRYTSYTPTNVIVDYWLKGGKGSLQMKEAKRHVGPRGVLRTSEHLSDRAMSKVRAARTFVVQIAIPAAPANCAQYSSQRLTVKHAGSGQVTWSRPS